jgi:LmbE family N-acetylglucosaminyl deacetylase
VAVRRAEDERALAALGVDGLHLDMLDAIYRCPDWYDRDESLFGAVAPNDPLPRQIARAVRELACQLPGARFLLPLGVGEHIDHRIVHAAGSTLAELGAPTAFYEDLPYALDDGRTVSRRQAIALALVARDVDVTATIERKLEAASVYASQIESLFGSRESMRTRLRDRAGRYRSGVLSERVWNLVDRFTG